MVGKVARYSIIMFATFARTQVGIAMEIAPKSLILLAAALAPGAVLTDARTETSGCISWRRRGMSALRGSNQEPLVLGT